MFDWMSACPVIAPFVLIHKGIKRFQQVLLNRQKEKKNLMEAVKKHRKGMKGQLEQMLNNAKSFQLDEVPFTLHSH